MEILLEYEQYMPHGMCLLWQPWLVILWAGSDLLIFLSYMLIPFALFMVLRQRKDIKHRGLVTLFASFILLCGITHALSIVTLWTAIYPLMGTVKLATGLVSMATAVVLFRLVPTLVSLPSPEKLKQANAQLRQARDELEGRVRQRTEELSEANVRLAFVARDAVHRSRNLIATVNSMTQPGIDASDDPARFLRELRGRINALAIATSTVMEHTDQSTATLERVVRRQVEPLLPNAASQLQVSGAAIDIGAEGAQQISLVVWELASRRAQLGAAAARRRSIAVEWQTVRSTNEADQLVFQWREGFAMPGMDDTYDSALIEGNDPSDFGSVLLLQIVPRLLQGRAVCEYDAGGLVYRLTCPLLALAEIGPEKNDMELAKTIIRRDLQIEPR